MAEQDLRFSPTSSKDVGTFKLIELPPEICKLIEDSQPLSLTIKGQTTEEAVLCTSDKTYSIRSVVLSNAVLVITRPPEDWDGAGDAIVIRDECHEILELIPSVPRLHKLSKLLCGMEYDEGQEDLAMDIDEDDRPNKPRDITYEDAQREIQASEAELAAAMKDKHILILSGCLRPISSAYLSTILELLLNTLISLGLSHKAAPVDELVDALADEHEVSRQVSGQVIGWFGEISFGKWKMCVDDVVREVGLGILRNHKDNPITEDKFIKQWIKAVGDTFESAVLLSLLSGNYLSTPSSSFDPSPVLTYFPSSDLPLEHPARFADLFLTRARWRAHEIAPFLAECAVNTKERDKLLLKYARATTEGKEVFYTSRAKYNG